MRLDHPRAARRTKVLVLAGALAIGLAAAAHAQINPIVFDGNIVWNSGPGGTTFYAGAAAAGSVCQPGLDSTTVSIATSQYTHNSAVDPLLSAALSVANPNWRPAVGSPAFCGNSSHAIVAVPNDGFFQQANFAGAIGAGDPDWTQGWTYYGLDGGGRSFPVRPLVVLDNQSLYGDRAFSADSNYLVRGQLRVKDQATLTIPAGTVIFQERATIGTMIIERGARIVAIGTADAPILLTSDAAPGSQTPGGTGGLFIHGRARINAANSCAGDSAASEGGAVGFYGGNDDADSSGVLRYVRSEFAGVNVAANNEANGITLNGVGSRTVIEYIQVHRSSDDLFELFGGTAQAKHLVLTYGWDDCFDWQMGYRGKAQFVIGRQLAAEAGADRGIEADNNEFANDTEICSGRSNPTLSNFTLIGDRGAGPAVTAGVFLRRGTGGRILNSIVSEWKTAALEINGAATFANHCADRAGIVAPVVVCGPGAADAPIASGEVFVAFGRPNPARNDYAITFALPAREDVSVDVFSADGRLVKQLARGAFDAGRHTVRWDVDRQLPAGMYFYQVRAGAQQTSGKFIRIE